MIKFFKNNFNFTNDEISKNDIRIYKRDNEILVSVGDWCELSDEDIKNRLKDKFKYNTIEVDCELGDMRNSGYEQLL
jgi:hypothetical protein